MKHLYDSLRGCAKEEEVKAEFCKFLKMKIFALRGIDHYTERVLFEFKYDRNFRNPEPWLDGGSLEWRIPNVCRPATDYTGITNIFKITHQNFSITANGTVQVMKFGYMVERTTNGTVNAWRTNEN